MERNHKQLLWLLAVGLATLAVSLMVGWWPENTQKQTANPTNVEETTPPTEEAVPEVTSEPADEPARPTIDKAALEKMATDFEIPDNARFSIVIEDLTNQERLISHNSEQLYPTASLYKLYLTYLAYEDIDSGHLALDQPFIRHPLYLDLDLGTCLNLTIEVSDSPCGEGLLNHYDYATIQARLEQLGLPQVNAAGFQASAEDMIRLLGLIYGDNLSEDSRRRLLGSMRDQAYNRILQPAFKGRGQVYNKTGTYRAQPGGEYNWIVAGIVELNESDSALAVSVLHENVPLEDLVALVESLAEVIP